MTSKRLWIGFFACSFVFVVAGFLFLWGSQKRVRSFVAPPLIETVPAGIYVETPAPNARDIVARTGSESYDRGYQAGKLAFMKQAGVDLPPVAAYTSKSSAADYVELDEDEVAAGYVDGYHAASNMFYCPPNRQK